MRLRPFLLFHYTIKSAVIQQKQYHAIIAACNGIKFHIPLFLYVSAEQKKVKSTPAKDRFRSPGIKKGASP